MENYNFILWKVLTKELERERDWYRERREKGQKRPLLEQIKKLTYAILEN